MKSESGVAGPASPIVSAHLDDHPLFALLQNLNWSNINNPGITESGKTTNDNQSQSRSSERINKPIPTTDRKKQYIGTYNLTD